MEPVKYFEEDSEAAKWEENLYDQIARKLCKRQERWIDMVGTRGPGSNPRVREEFFEEFDKVFDEVTVYFRNTLMCRYLQNCHEDQIDMSPEVAAEYNWQMGYDTDDDRYVEGVE